MARKRVLRVLFVRPAVRRALPALFGFPDRRDPADVLPVALLRLATTVKLGSPHRVFVYDARRDRAGNRSTRAVARVHRADVAVIELQLPLLADGLEAARAAREGHCKLVLATGPLVEQWPDAVAGMPEFDGLLHPGGAPSLLAVLSRAATDELGARTLGDALALAPAPPPDDAQGCDRRLLDYAAYRAAHDAMRAGRGHRVDKGREAATPVLLEDESNDLRTPSDVLAELDECSLLGISKIALRSTSHPSMEWLREVATSPASERRLVLPRPAGAAVGLELLRDAGARSLDLGDVPVGDADAVAEAGEWIEAGRSAGLEVLGRACFGRGEAEAEERGLAVLRSWEVPLGAVLMCEVPPRAEEHARVWSSWLTAPRPGFVPPVAGGHRSHELAERARVLLAQHDARGARAFAGRLARWAQSL